MQWETLFLVIDHSNNAEKCISILCSRIPNLKSKTANLYKNLLWCLADITTYINHPDLYDQKLKTIIVDLICSVEEKIANDNAIALLNCTPDKFTTLNKVETYDILYDAYSKSEPQYSKYKIITSYIPSKIYEKYKTVNPKPNLQKVFDDINVLLYLPILFKHGNYLYCKIKTEFLRSLAR